MHRRASGSADVPREPAVATRRRVRRLPACAALLIPIASAWAQNEPPASPLIIQLPPIEVIGASPLLGAGVNANTVPGATHSVNSAQIGRTGVPNAVQALDDFVPGISTSAAAGNPEQLGVFYHGFQASPLQGVPQGLAVYVNGVRFNQAFGDTVHFDFIPDVAIDRMDLVGSNPVFGLNALGGALSMRMKNGFTDQGTEISAYGGSFGQVGGNFQYGRQSGGSATYVAASVQHEAGWRDQQSSDLYQVYGDVGWRSDKAELHLNIIGADTQLNGPGTSPIELLSANPAAQFTAPNLIASKYSLIGLNGNWSLSDTTTLQAVAYYDYLSERVVNGNVTDFSPCSDGLSLCGDSGQVATGLNGNPISAFLGSGPYSQLDQQTTNTNGYGTSLQATYTGDVFGHANQLIVGGSYDGAQTTFTASSSIGGLGPDSRDFLGPGVVIAQPDGSIAPVRVGVGNSYYGLFISDIYAITPSLHLTLAGRFNSAQIGLQDQNGSALTGQHAYNHFNPSAGLSWEALPWLTIYGSYSIANRAPTPLELSCASAASPCSLANFFVGDPNLKQVVSGTAEVGVRGHAVPFEAGRLDWQVGLYRSNLTDDILFVDSPIQGRAFFTNVGETLRQGLDAGLRLTTQRISAWVNFSYISATFQSPFVASSPNNPAADADGNITVRSGNRLPGIPTYQGKLGIDYKITDAWSAGANVIVAAGQYLVGDEANLTPKLPPYVVLTLTTRYQVTKALQVFATVQNVTNEKYYTYGTFSPTSSVPIAQVPNASNPRSYSPAAPVGAFGGVRLTF
jgi:iron complex outermembrane recepter protein